MARVVASLIRLRSAKGICTIVEVLQDVQVVQEFACARHTLSHLVMCIGLAIRLRMIYRRGAARGVVVDKCIGYAIRFL